jgi:FSR family fosmidomycin resistance protein-like MFS transporter
MSIAPLCMLVFVNAGGWLLVPLLILVGLTFISSTPVVLAIVQEHASEHPATANGLYMGISFVISSVSPTLLGWLADLTDLQTAFTYAALLALAAVPLIYFLPRKH